LKISELIEKLSNLGIKVYIGKPGEVRLNVPNPLPIGAHSLLAELKQHKAEAIEYLSWDEAKALVMLQEALGRIKQRYLAGALPWAAEHSLDCYRTLQEAEARVNLTHQAQDMAGCRVALGDYERAFNELIEEYNRQRILTTEESIAAFGYTRVWELPLHKAVVLDAAFAKEGTRWR